MSSAPLKPQAIVATRFRVHGILERSPPSYLVSELGRRGRPRWVLEEIPRSALCSPELRSAMADIACLAHPTLALPVNYEFDPALGRFFSVRPYLEGSELVHATRSCKPTEMLPWLTAAAAALDRLHRCGIAHGRVRLESFIVPGQSSQRKRSPPRVVLADPAWPTSGTGKTVESRPSTEVPPRAQQVFAADLSALGSVFYRLLTGHSPELDPEGFPLSPSELHPGVPLDLGRIVAMLLGRDPAPRYESSGALVSDLSRLLRVELPRESEPLECFVDRRAELRRVLDALSDKSSPSVLTVESEPGMGRSAFLRRVEIEAQLLGYRTVSIRCVPDDDAPHCQLRALGDRLVPPSSGNRSLRTLLRAALRDAERKRAGTARQAEHVQLASTVAEIALRLGTAQPLLVVVDDAHFARAPTLHFVAACARHIMRANALDASGPSSSVVSLVVSHRCETPFRKRLGPFFDVLAAGGERWQSLELGRLSDEAVVRWLELATEGEQNDENTRSVVLRQALGLPFAVSQTLSGGRQPRPRSATRNTQGDPDEVRIEYLSSLDESTRGMLEVLAVLDRPATVSLVAKVLGSSRSRLESARQRLEADGALGRRREGLSFRHSSFKEWVHQALDARRTRNLHGEIARVLEPTAPVEEVAYHWLHSDTPREGMQAYLAAARLLARTGEAERAEVFYQGVLDATAPEEHDERSRSARELAALFVRNGQHRRAAETLELLLPLEAEEFERGSLHGKIGVARHRAGDVEPAIEHLETALSVLAGSHGRRWLRERLEFASELVEALNNRGEVERAERICREALAGSAAECSHNADSETRRSEMVLLETLAHIRLRRFEYPEARQLFERSLAIGEELGVTSDTSLILNNLGILHNQENRFHEAIRCYRRAAALAVEHENHSVLANIHSNLALLHAKTGDTELADESLREAARHETCCDSRRVRFLRLHSSGLASVLTGRYGAAIKALEAAIALGEELNDYHVLASDLIYLGEAHVLRSEFDEGRRALDRALTLPGLSSGPLPSMAASRLMLLQALSGEGGAEKGRRTPGGDDDEHDARVPSYLRAWNAVFRGWALRLLGNREEASTLLHGALSFFRRVQVPAGEVLSALELSLLEAEAGEVASADRGLRELRERFRCGQGALASPMLAARLLVYHARVLLTLRPPDVHQAAAALTEAEGYLVGQHLDDLEALVRELRARLRAEYLRGRIEAPGRQNPAEPDPGGSVSRSTRQCDAGSAVPRVTADWIVGQSPATRNVRALVSKLGPSSRPVLVTGENGTGKKLVAQALHGESERSPGPFVAVDCAALTSELVEAELFGYRQGAFSGADEDRDGLVESARGGTCFFDGVAELPLSLQAKLLRLVDRHSFRRIGDTEEISVDARFVFSSDSDLRQLVEARRFRADLFFRLNAVEIRLLPLRERASDVPDLVAHFLASLPDGLAVPVFREDAVALLETQLWPGNLHELRGVVQRLAFMGVSTVEPRHVRLVLHTLEPKGLFSEGLLRSRSLEELRAALEREYYAILYRDVGGNFRTMASRLGIGVQALYKRLRSLGIQRTDLH